MTEDEILKIKITLILLGFTPEIYEEEGIQYMISPWSSEAWVNIVPYNNSLGVTRNNRDVVHRVTTIEQITKFYKEELKQ